MNIAVIGTGYVGLVTGTCLADTGNNVICVDIDSAKVEKLKVGVIPIYEPHLEVLFERNIKQNRLAFTTNLKKAVDQSQIIFLALPTPQGEDGSADLSYVLNVADELGKIITGYKIVVDKSTVPVGTSEKVCNAISANSKVEFDVVSNPEFLREGFAVDDFLKPDRVVIGSSSDRANAVMRELYRPYVRQGNPIIFMDEKSAELTKYAANAFLATKITFMNEVANYCEKVGADADMVRIGMGTDNRIGKRFLFPGIGYGGSCFPKDVQALQKSGMDENHDFKILRAVLEVNTKQRVLLVGKIKDYFGADLSGKKIAIWGLAFKPDTDDIREAPALYIIEELLEAGASINGYDQEAMKNTEALLGDKVSYAEDEYSCLQDCDALVIATEWPLFRTPDFGKIKSSLKAPVIFDGRNLYDLDQMEGKGIYYSSIGRKLVEK
ncbi:MAG: UDP-glucose/GDP-mannose dehydrogenase family protein [Flavobacteriales bacterium]|nr:UDP-glucose/GDP-mannose dehydrogenase family protein [Flavobacteriales bacterium]